MPKLEVRLTERQMERLDAAATAASMSRSDYARWRCLGEEPGGKHRQAQRVAHERGLRERARAARAAALPKPRSSTAVAPEPFLTPQMVAMQGAVTFAHAEELIQAGRVRLDNGHLLIDGRPV